MANAKENLKAVVAENAGMFSPENIDQLANVLGKSLKGFLQDKQTKLVDLKDHYEETIKERPISSMATAFAAGIILGLLFRRN